MYYEVEMLPMVYSVKYARLLIVRKISRDI